MQDRLYPEIHNRRFWLTPEGRLEIYDFRLACKVNRLLGHVERGEYKFKPGEEFMMRKLRCSNLTYCSLMRLLAPKSTLTVAA